MKYFIPLHVLTLYSLLLQFHGSVTRAEDSEEAEKEEGRPTKCEVCKYFTRELQERLDESGKTNQMLNLQYRIDSNNQKRKKYRESETRLVEALDDPPLCDEIRKYNVHAERKGSLRYAKGMSQTMQTLHGLVDKGVKVELGYPYEMWDSTHAEVTDMQRQCEMMKEEYENDIEDWYFHHQEVPLVQYLCKDRILKDISEDEVCLTEVEEPEPGQKGDTANAPKKKKEKNAAKDTENDVSDAETKVKDKNVHEDL